MVSWDSWNLQHHQWKYTICCVLAYLSSHYICLSTFFVEKTIFHWQPCVNVCIVILFTKSPFLSDFPCRLADWMPVGFDFMTTAELKTQFFWRGPKQIVRRIYCFCLIWFDCWWFFTLIQTDQIRKQIAFHELCIQYTLDKTKTYCCILIAPRQYSTLTAINRLSILGILPPFARQSTALRITVDSFWNVMQPSKFMNCGYFLNLPVLPFACSQWKRRTKKKIAQRKDALTADLPFLTIFGMWHLNPIKKKISRSSSDFFSMTLYASGPVLYCLHFDPYWLVCP